MPFSKIMIVDETDYLTQHIFFDDNITEDDDCIVDCRDVLEGKSIPLKKSLNKYLVKVHPIDVLKDSEFFVKQIDQCEKLRLEEIERIERGITSYNDENQEVLKKSEYELLLEANDSEYLRKTIMPLLHPALKLVDIERPIDPISFIALYCLKNQAKVKIPQPPEGFFDKKEEEVMEGDQQPNVQLAE